MAPCLLVVLYEAFKESSAAQKQHVLDRFPFALEPLSCFIPLCMFIWKYEWILEEAQMHLFN